MEFLRFGSSIPGGYWGCCAMDIIQNFNFDPDAKASIQDVSGDTGAAVGDRFFGPTYHDIFKTRIRVGTFGTRDMPNHGFLAILTSGQCSSTIGKKWLAILKEEGFEFIRAIDNSVYTGNNLGGSSSAHPNYVFGLFRNIGNSKISDPFTPPTSWSDLPPVTAEAYQFLEKDAVASINEQQTEYQTKRWKEGVTKFLTAAEVEAAGAPVTLAGLRSQFPPQTKEQRDAIKETQTPAVNNATAAFPGAA